MGVGGWLRVVLRACRDGRVVKGVLGVEYAKKVDLECE
jgi:hypothetical protein